jgi:hypothetical protein
MPTITENYYSGKLELLKKMIENYKNAHTPRYFEIVVDGLKVVPKTCNLDHFDLHEDFVTDDTREVVVLLYFFSEKSPKHDKHIFECKEKEKPIAPAPPVLHPIVQESLSGIEIDKRISDHVKMERERWDAESVKKELEATKKELEEAQSYIQKLQDQLEKAKDGKVNITGAGVGEFLTGAVIGAVKENPKLLAKIPAGFSGFLGVNDTSKEEKESEEEEEPSFKKKASSQPSISEEEKELVSFARQIGTAFIKPQIDKIMGIINCFSRDKTLIDLVASLLTKEKKEDKK